MKPYLGQISLFAFGNIPQGWMACNGQLLEIRSFQALFSLLGTSYGGDGRVNFALPDLRGRVAVQSSSSDGSNYGLGTHGGSEGVALTIQSFPTHKHFVRVVNSAGNKVNGLGNLLAGSAPIKEGEPPPSLFADSKNLVSINPASISQTGGGAAHNNMQPFLAVTFCIAIEGIYPSSPSSP